MSKLFKTDPLNVAMGSYELTLTGKIYADVAPQLKSELMESVDKGLKFLIVNAETLEQIDSSGLNVFVALLKKIRPSGGKVVFFGLNPNIQRVFEITKLATVMGVVDARPEALGEHRVVADNGEDLDFDDFDLDEIERHLKVLERTLPAETDAYDARRAHLERAAFPRFVAWLGPRGMPRGSDVQRRLEDDARVIVEEVCREWTPRPTAADVSHVARRIALDILGTGPLQDFLDDPEVSEIMVNGPGRVMIERKGRLEETGVSFRDEQHLTNTIRKIAERMDRRIDFQSPTLDGRLTDGSRVHAILPPIALDGPQLTIRKFGERYTQIEDLIQNDTLRPEMAYYLGACVKARLNIAIGGPSASGKTTTLNVLATQIPPRERLVTIEELSELDFSESHCHVVRLQARTENVDGAGEMSIRTLVREALRMRADRIVVGEARGAEMIDVLQAMRCGHDGSMTTIHASSAPDVIQRAVTIGLFSEVALTESSLRYMVVDSLDVVVVLARFANGVRKVIKITEPYMSPTGEVRFNDVFEFDRTGYDGEQPTGNFRWIGPTRHEERFHRMGIDVPEAALGDLG